MSDRLSQLTQPRFSRPTKRRLPRIGLLVFGLTLLQTVSPDWAIAATQKDATAALDDEKAAKIANARGLGLFNKRDYQNALVKFDQAIRLNPKDATLHVNRGAALLELSQYTEAHKAVGQALQLDPEQEQARDLLSLIQKRENWWPEAVVYHRQPVDDDWWTQWERGLVLLSQGQDQEARKSMKAAIKLAEETYKKDPQWNEAARIFLVYASNYEGREFFLRTRVASTLDEKKDYSRKAMEKHAEAIRWQPNDPSLHVNHSLAARIHVYYLNGEKSSRSLLLRARRSAKRALELDSNYDRALREIGWVFNAEGVARNNAGKPDKLALAYYDEALQYLPEEPVIHRNRATELYRQYLFAAKPDDVRETLLDEGEKAAQTANQLAGDTSYATPLLRKISYVRGLDLKVEKLPRARRTSSPRSAATAAAEWQGNVPSAIDIEYERWEERRLDYIYPSPN